MDMITVRVVPATEGGELYPQYDRESKLLEVGSVVDQEWPYGFDVNGTIIFDVDREHILTNFELLIPRSYWKETDRVVFPKVATVGSLQIPVETLGRRTFNLPIGVGACPGKNKVLVIIGHKFEPVKFVQLSPQCIACLTQKTELNGFYLNLI